MLTGLRSTWRNPGYNLRGKLFHTIWFPLAALLPQAAATNIIRRGLLPGAGREKFPRPPPSNCLAIPIRSWLRQSARYTAS